MKLHKCKYIFIVGGVISGLGKGITAASIGKLLKLSGYKVTNIKIDAYVNVDAGTMNPLEHGEVFVTKDGMETDQDIGNYERFLNVELTSDNYTTTGQIYKSLIDKERNLLFNGKCVEVVPHVPLEIIEKINKAAKENDAEIAIVEIGGTIGEYQNILFIEAARMLKYHNPKDVLIALVSYVPIPKILGEMKTKPTQNASRTLNETGIQADLIICRGEKEIDKRRKEKIAMQCNMMSDKDILSAPDAKSVYEVPLILHKQDIIGRIIDKLNLKNKKNNNFDKWQKFIDKIEKLKEEINIGIVGKYFGNNGDYVLSDVYISVIEAIKHASWANNVRPKLSWIDAEQFENNKEALNDLKKYQAIVVPGGFGERGVEGIISAISFARINKIPYLGLCYGMQLATVEFARNVAGLANAHTAEIKPKCKDPIIHIMPEQIKKILSKEYGGSMRLGEYGCKIKQETNAFESYQEMNLLKNNIILERHRHRYEFNNKYRKILEDKGLVIAGTSPDNQIVEIIELDKGNHPFFVGVQFHPEFKSYPEAPHPLFKKLIEVAKKIENK